MSEEERRQYKEEMKQEIADFLRETGHVIAPCPFCGNRNDWDFSEVQDCPEGIIICERCGCMLGGWSSDDPECRIGGWKGIIEKWNKRAFTTTSDMGRMGGLKGGTARAKSLSPERRSEIATKAANARWSKNPEPAIDPAEKDGVGVGVAMPSNDQIDARYERHPELKRCQQPVFGDTLCSFRGSVEVAGKPYCRRHAAKLGVGKIATRRRTEGTSSEEEPSNDDLQRETEDLQREQEAIETRQNQLRTPYYPQGPGNLKHVKMKRTREEWAAIVEQARKR